jgi:hypothetical protein
MQELRSADVTIFTGVPRSGTTLVGELANRYLDVAAVNEGPFEAWLSEQVRSEAQLGDDRFFQRLLEQLAGHLYFGLLYSRDPGDVPVQAIVSRLNALIGVRTLENVALAVLQVTREKMGHLRLGHEDPRLIKDLPEVLRVLPRCRIVHIVRDPRDVTNSVLRLPWGPNNAVFSAEVWDRWVRIARRVGAQLGPQRFLEIRYEDLLAQPRETMTALMRFVCGDVDKRLLEQFVQEMGVNPLRGNSGTWRGKLSDREIQAIEAITREMMAAYDYEPALPPSKVSIVSKVFWRIHNRAVQVKRMFMGDLASDGGAVPVIKNAEALAAMEQSTANQS